MSFTDKALVTLKQGSSENTVPVGLQVNQTKGLDRHGCNKYTLFITVTNTHCESMHLVFPR